MGEGGYQKKICRYTHIRYTFNGVSARLVCGQVCLLCALVKVTHHMLEISFCVTLLDGCVDVMDRFVRKVISSYVYLTFGNNCLYHTLKRSYSSDIEK